MNKLKITILDAATLGEDIDFSLFDTFGDVTAYGTTSPECVEERISESEVIIVNKLKLNKSNLGAAKKLKIICVTATGFDNIELQYCREHGIAVCNVKGYSTESVAQVTAAMALSLVCRIPQYNEFVRSGDYTKSGIQNRITPVFHELCGMTWGIVGLGGIGKRVEKIARSFGCKTLAFKRTPEEGYECVPLRTLCERADIISVHLPLTDETRGIIDESLIKRMKTNAIVINAARGAVADEEALAKAVIGGNIGGLGIDVYSAEPMAADSPYVKAATMPNVILTPHMAWGAYEARVRCMEEIAWNIEAFCKGEIRNRVDI